MTFSQIVAAMIARANRTGKTITMRAAKRAARKAQAVCPLCGYSDQADLNAAKKLLSWAKRSVLPVGEIPDVSESD